MVFVLLIIRGGHLALLAGRRFHTTGDHKGRDYDQYGEADM
jgi:hypothetical protein